MYHPQGGGGGHLPQVWKSTVKLTLKVVAMTSSGRRAVILYSEAMGHLYLKGYSLITIMAIKTGYEGIIIITIKPIFHCDAKKLRWALALA